MANFGMRSVNRTVPVPIERGDKKIMALIEMGSKLFKSKTVTYTMFFEEGAAGVEKRLMDTIKSLNGDVEDYNKLFSQAVEKVNAKFGDSEKEEKSAPKKRKKAPVK